MAGYISRNCIDEKHKSCSKKSCKCFCHRYLWNRNETIKLAKSHGKDNPDRKNKHPHDLGFGQSQRAFIVMAREKVDNKYMWDRQNLINIQKRIARNYPNQKYKPNGVSSERWFYEQGYGQGIRMNIKRLRDKRGGV